MVRVATLVHNKKSVIYRSVSFNQNLTIEESFSAGPKVTVTSKFLMLVTSSHFRYFFEKVTKLHLLKSN